MTFKGQTHLSCNPHIEPIQLDSAHKDGYPYLGLKFITSNKIKDHVMRNLNANGEYRYYAWLENNDLTPIDVTINSNI